MTIPVLFLHGWSMHGAIFDDITKRLGSEFDCVAPDLPGHGTRRENAATLKNCADLAGRYIKSMDQPILVGWSMGAAIAWRYIALYGTSAIRALVTIDMSPRLVPEDDWSLGLGGQSAESIKLTSSRIIPDWSRMTNSIVRTMFAPDSAPIISRKDIRDFLLTQNPAYLRSIWDDLIMMDERKTISRIDIPYLICSGEKSSLYKQEVSLWIAARVNGARLQNFANSGHSPHLEEPDTFCDVFRQFTQIEKLVSTNQN